MRVIALCTLLAALVGAAPAVAGGGGMAWLGQGLPAASARAVAGDLKAAQAQVDASLKQRKKRFDAWRKASASRDRAAQAVQVRKQAKAPRDELEPLLARALQLDETAARARTALLASEAEVARGGAELLRLYDALLVERRREVEALAPSDAERPGRIAAYKELATQRDAVRRALLPVLKDEAPSEAPHSVDLEARAGDDVEALLAKADLARDLEDRALRQAEQIARRVRELEEEQGVARDVSGLVARSQLFDEEDRRLLVVRQDLQAAAATGLSGAQRPRGEADDAARVGPAPNEAAADGSSTPTVSVAGPTLNTSAGDVAAPAFAQTEQAFAGPQTDSGIAGLLSSSSVSVGDLRALEKRLRAEAAQLRQKSQRLKVEAQSRAGD